MSAEYRYSISSQIKVKPSFKYGESLSYLSHWWFAEFCDFYHRHRSSVSLGWIRWILCNKHSSSSNKYW